MYVSVCVCMRFELFYVLLGFWVLEQDPGFMILGSVSGSLGPGSGVQDLRFSILDPGFRSQASGSRMHNPESWIQGPGS